jgi:type II secretory pathway component PulM
MKSKKRKWEELLDDAGLEARILNTSKVRFRNESDRNRMLASTTLAFLFLMGVFTYTSIISPADELSNNVSMILEELDANPFLYLAED